MRSLYAAIMGLCWACTSASVFSSTRTVQVGPPLNTEPAPEAPTPPEPGPDGFVPTREAITFERAFRSYLRAYRTWMIAKQGWRPYQLVQTRRIDRDVFSSGDRLQEDSERDYKDKEGKTWTFVGEAESTCANSGGRMNLYVDAAGSIFLLQAGHSCKSTQKIKVQGTFPAGGCGVAPHGGRAFFVQVPKSAAVLRGEPKRFDYPVELCYQIEPTEGFSHPP